MNLLRRSLLPRKPEGLDDFWAVVHVQLPAPLLVDDDQEPTYLVGYYRNFGLRASADNVPLLLEQSVVDGKIDWDATEWYAVDPSTLDKVVRKRIQPIAGQGIWYTSGRAYYPPDDSAAVPTQ